MSDLNTTPLHLVSINRSAGHDLSVGGRIIHTGIAKTPVQEAEVGQLGLAGDLVANVKHHGGPDQAVYLYSAADYTWWARQLDRELTPGSFGENLTLSDFGPGPVHIGDRYQVGDVLLEVTAPRIPCSTLAAHMDDPEFIARFRAAERPGFYARVLKPGMACVGDVVHVSRADGFSLIEAYRLWYTPEPDADLLRQALATPVATRMRARWEKWLAQG